MYTIQKPTTKEYEEIDNLVKKTWIYTYAHGDITSEDIEKSFITKGNYDANTHIVKDGDLIIGMIRAINKGNFIYLHQMYIDPKYHRQGIGSLLMQTIPKDKRIVCGVFSYNTQAINFYIKHGFTKIDKPEGEFMINGKPIATVLYERMTI